MLWKAGYKGLITFHFIVAAFGWSHRGCKCGPDDRCWPSSSRWASFNSTLGGKLISDEPVAKSCYPGSEYDVETCAKIGRELSDQTFVSNNPIALSYPTDSCPPVNLSADPCSIGYSNSKPCNTESGTGNAPPKGTCSIGDQPRYTINATEISDVVAGVNFARDSNIRLVIRDTGHDILRRSTGYGSLQIWIRNLRKGIYFQQKYQPSQRCLRSGWNGPAFFIGGGYTWQDVYPIAASRNVVVVGGGTPSVGCLGGWMQGGGHGPAAHDYGLGADQVLEAQVVLASGKVITASPCQHPEIFLAIRGGGPSSYGVVISTVVKAHPNKQVTAQVFGFAPLSERNMPEFMEALTTIHQHYPYLSDNGFSGYGSWSIYSPKPLVANYSTGFIHTIATFGNNLEDAQKVLVPLGRKFSRYNGTSLFVTSKYYSFQNFSHYYNTLSNVNLPVGSSAALGSRFLDRTALSGSVAALKVMLQNIAGTPEQATSNNIVFVGGGQVARDAADPYSGVNPAWRKAYVHNIVARGWEPGAANAAKQTVHHDITYAKVQAMKRLTPRSGSYMNEGDRFDPDYLQSFYGANLAKLSAIKRKFDPYSVFYCPTCVGSERWSENAAGVLCPSRPSPWGVEIGWNLGWGNSDE